MVPSDKEEVIGILDTFEECLIVDDYFARSDRTADRKNPASFDAPWHAPRSRFIAQAQELRGGYSTDDEPFLRHNPTFEVLEEDGDWVLDAAQYILDEQKLVRRLINRITKRKKAAEDIASFILRYRQTN